MTRLLIRWLILTAAITVASHLLQGIKVHDLASSLLAAAVLGMLNVSLRPLMLILTLPLNVLSLGVLTFLINALMLKIVSFLISGFEVHGFWTAVFGSLIISIISWLLQVLIRDISGSDRRMGGRRGGPGGSDDTPDCVDLKQRTGDRWE